MYLGLASLYLNKRLNRQAKTMKTQTLTRPGYPGGRADRDPGSKDRRYPQERTTKPTKRKGFNDDKSNGSRSVATPVVYSTRLPVKAAGKNLKKQYRYALQLGAILSLTVMITLFRLPLKLESAFESIVVEQEIVQMEEIVQTEQQLKAPPPPRPAVPIEVPNDEIIVDEEFELDVALDLDDVLTDLVAPALPDPVDEEPEDEAEIFIAVEEMPTIIGGREKLYEFVEYPAIAREASLEGTVVVQLVIEKDGTPSNVGVLKSVHEILDKAAVSAIEQIRFNPGKQRGQPVRVKMAIPIRFKIL